MERLIEQVVYERDFFKTDRKALFELGGSKEDLVVHKRCNEETNMKLSGQLFLM